MATEVNKNLPKVINKIALPKFQELKDDDRSDAADTVRAWHDAIHNFSSNATRIFADPGKYKPQRLITLKTKYNRTGTIKPELKATRVQAADSVVKFMYGTVLKDTHACDACQKGNGLYDGYVVLNDLTPGCANCHYAGTANKCSLVTAKAQLSTPSSDRKRKSKDVPESAESTPSKRHRHRTKPSGSVGIVSGLIATAPTNVLRNLGDLFSAMADEKEAAMFGDD
ncbi:hypothetical protein HDV62DRAFT_376527 [Trichoderma sp. SZMC 28011]